MSKLPFLDKKNNSNSSSFAFTIAIVIPGVFFLFIMAFTFIYVIRKLEKISPKKFDRFLIYFYGTMALPAIFFNFAQNLMPEDKLLVYTFFILSGSLAVNLLIYIILKNIAKKSNHTEISSKHNQASKDGLIN